MEAEAIYRRRSGWCRAVMKGSVTRNRKKFEESGGLCIHCELPRLKNGI